MTKKGNRYVLGTCSYCDKTTQFHIGDHTQTQFECPNCGAPVNVVFAEEERVPNYVDSYEDDDMSKVKKADISDRQRAVILGTDDDDEMRKLKKRFEIIWICVFVFLFILYFYVDSHFNNDELEHERTQKENSYYMHNEPQTEEEKERREFMEEQTGDFLGFNKELPLEGSSETGLPDSIKLYRYDEYDSNAYHMYREKEYDKSLFTDGQKYHDEELDYYITRDTETGEFLYWYEPISGNYDDYGLMKREEGTWYIETEEDVWEEVTEDYDTSELYYIVLK
ncbi:MAG: hypothetical protein J5802_11750 [Butyrivibrio sp.]|nr:hypothetical protein [Butyrivibrio sp.]